MKARDKEVTDAVNRALDALGPEEAQLDPAVRAAARRRLLQIEWQDPTHLREQFEISLAQIRAGQGLTAEECLADLERYEAELDAEDALREVSREQQEGVPDIASGTSGKGD